MNPAARTSTPLLALLTFFALVPLGLDYVRAVERGESEIDAGGMKLLPPRIARERSALLLAHDRSLDEILARRRWTLPAAEDANGCELGVGLSRATQTGEPWVLLESTPWGRLAEIPRKGIAVVPHTRAREMSRSGHCVRLVPSSTTSPPSDPSNLILERAR